MSNLLDVCTPSGRARFLTATDRRLGIR